MKVLYFEGAGMDYTPNSQSDVGNYRIRTAFVNKEGKKIYLEMGSCPRFDKKGKEVFHWGLRIDLLFYITGDRDNSNKNAIRFDLSYLRDCYTYTKQDITRVVNGLCNADFDTIEALPDLAGYRVFKEDGYNFSNDFVFDREKTARAERIRAHFYEVEKAEGKKHPNLSIWVDQDNPEILHLLRHFPGYNKHWIIHNVDNWQDTVKETFLGQCGC